MPIRSLRDFQLLALQSDNCTIFIANYSFSPYVSSFSAPLSQQLYACRHLRPIVLLFFHKRSSPAHKIPIQILKRTRQIIAFKTDKRHSEFICPVDTVHIKSIFTKTSDVHLMAFIDTERPNLKQLFPIQKLANCIIGNQAHIVLIFL